jgi:hypothetical protein
MDATSSRYSFLRKHAKEVDSEEPRLGHVPAVVTEPELTRMSHSLACHVTFGS